jgi:murein DD-endopeptidase MepM/ murein hydrolase activator NlpD
LATQPLPIGCSWPTASEHPLTERVALIVGARPSRARVLWGAALVALASAGCGGLAWAVQPPSVVSAPAASDPPSVSVASSVSVPASMADPQPAAPEQEAPAPNLPTQSRFRITGAASPILMEPAWLISAFGPRIDVFNGQKTAFHTGIDLKATWGAPIHAPADGVIAFAGVKGSYGRVVDLKISDREILRFGHLNSIAVQAGARVKAGDKIGSMGSTGRSSGLHVHVEYLYDGEHIDPLLVRNLKLATSLDETPVPETPGWPTRTEDAAAAESPPAPEAQPAPDAPP